MVLVAEDAVSFEISKFNLNLSDFMMSTQELDAPVSIINLPSILFICPLTKIWFDDNI